MAHYLVVAHGIADAELTSCLRRLASDGALDEGRSAALDRAITDHAAGFRAREGYVSYRERSERLRRVVLGWETRTREHEGPS